MKTTNWLVISVAAVALISGTASADAPMFDVNAELSKGWGSALEERSTVPGTSDAFARLDKDLDGRISLQESRASPRLAGEFQRLDRDDNGGLDRNEYARSHGAMAHAREALIMDRP